MFKGPIDCAFHSNRFRGTRNIIYDLAYFARSDVSKDPSAGLDQVILDLFCVCTDNCNGAPTYTSCLRQVDRAALRLKQIFCVGGNSCQYCPEIQCDRDFTANFCEGGSLLCATLGLLE